MKKLTVSILLGFIVLSLCAFKNDEGAATIVSNLNLGSNVKNIDKNDDSAPEIDAKLDELNLLEVEREVEDEEGEEETQTVYQIQYPMGEDFDVTSYVEASDDSGEVTLTSFGQVDLEKIGVYEITVIATDSSMNASSLKMEVNVITKEDYDQKKSELEEARAQREREAAQRKAQEQRQAQIADLSKIAASGDLNALAQSMVGMGGDCYYIANLFLQSAYGISASNRSSTPISASEAQPGDIIFYQNGGLGTTHWAIYLGGTTALQGNFNGRTIIGSVYLPYGSAPIFYRTYH